MPVNAYFVLRLFAGVLHTIMFNRSLGQVKPQDVESELFDITYVSMMLEQQQWTTSIKQQQTMCRTVY